MVDDGVRLDSLGRVAAVVCWCVFVGHTTGPVVWDAVGSACRRDRRGLVGELHALVLGCVRNFDHRYGIWARKHFLLHPAARLLMGEGPSYEKERRHSK